PAFEALKELRRYGLLAVESEWEFSQGRLDDRPDFRDVTLGCLSPRDKLLLTRLQGAEIFTDGTLAGSWRTTQRMIRAAASGSMAVSLTSKEPVIPGIALWTPHTHSPAEAVVGEMRDPLALQSRAHLAWRTVMDRHTTAHRMQEVASLLGIAARFLPQPARVACLLVTMRPDRIRSCIQWFRDDLYANKELIVVVNGPEVDLGAYRRLVSEDDQIRFYQAGRNRSLGACLNYAASLTDAPYWLKIDDDDIYGRQYIADAMRYQASRPSAVFGKPPMFNYLERQDCLLWDQEWAQLSNVVHAASRSKFALIAGGTIGGRSDTLELVRFSESRRGGSDSDFVRRCYQAGLDVLAMDGFSF